MIVLKGPALARAVYPQDGLRPYRDIDVLVHGGDVDAVVELLEVRGYRDRYPDASGRLHAEHGGPQRVYEDHTNGLRVEVHSDHLQLGLEPVEMAEIWSRSQRADFGGVEARVLEPHDLFVHLCLHLHRHSFSRMIWFKDLDLLVRQGRLDWACVRERATAQGCIDSVSLSLELLEAVLGTPLPPEARALAASRARWTRWLQRLFWPTRRSVELELQRRWRLRRLVQFAPETGVIRGGLPSLLFTGRRRAKLRVLAAALPGRRRR